MLPLIRGENVNDFEYAQVSSAFFLALSAREEFETLSRAETLDLLRLMRDRREAEEDASDGNFRDSDDADIGPADADVYDLAREKDVDLVVFGSVGADRPRDQGGIRTVGIKVEIASVAQRRTFNKIAWSVSHIGPPEDRIANLATLAAQKLIWQASEAFPVRVNFADSSRDFIPRNRQDVDAYKQRMRAAVRDLELPAGVEIDSVVVNVREKREVSGAGLVGCLTLIGWMFVPYYNVDTGVDLLVRLKYLNKDGVVYTEFADANNDSESYHFTADAGDYEAQTLRILDGVWQSTAETITADRSLFRDRSKIVKQFFAKAR